MPFAIESFNLNKYDLILSSSHCVAKSVKPGPGSIHICYCHTPMRYIWDQFDQYFGRNKSGLIPWVIMKILRPWFQRWDSKTSCRVDDYIANSHHVKKRIKKYYHKEATVIHPPVNTKRFKSSGERKKDYFLIVSAFAPYKRVDLAVEAFNKLGYPFVVVGEGQDADSLRRMANPNVRFEGWLDDFSISNHYARCRAFVFCGEEDFGISLLEAQAVGRPVIALGRGGALETVIPDRKTWKPDIGIPENKTINPTGVFFYEQTSKDLIKAIQHFESVESQFDAEKIQQHAARFDIAVYRDRIKKFIEERLQRHRC